jgi:RNA polymerase sigma factor (sigma-70 family)
MPGDRSDAELIEASLANPEEFGTLFRRYYPAIYRYLTRMVGREEGNDLTADVFEKAFRARHTYDLARPSASSWLYGIASYVAIAHYRKRLRRNRIHPPAGGGPEVANSPDMAPPFDDDVASRVDAGAAHAELRLVLAKLRPEEREVVSLYVLADLTYPEIGEALGIPVGTVRSRLSRGRSRLRNHFLSRDQSSSEPLGESDE